MGSGKGGIARALAQGAPEMAAALPGQGEELLLAEADQWRFQEARQIEIVLRQQHEARRGQKILDGELFTQVQAVDTRHLDALALQGAYQRIHELVAPPHQHHEMAGMQQLAFTRALLAADQAFGMGGDQVGAACVRQRERAAWTFQVGRVDLGLGRTDQRPQLDPAGLVLAAGQMGHAAPPRRTPERSETLRSTGTNLCSAMRLCSANHSRISLSLRGSARWKPKIDCLVSPTANTVRLRSTAPWPAKNSSVRRRITSPWSGVVSSPPSPRPWPLP